MKFVMENAFNTCANRRNRSHPSWSRSPSAKHMCTMSFLRNGMNRKAGALFVIGGGFYCTVLESGPRSRRVYFGASVRYSDRAVAIFSSGPGRKAILFSRPAHLLGRGLTSPVDLPCQRQCTARMPLFNCDYCTGGTDPRIQ